MVDRDVTVVDDHIDDPDTGATETLKNGTKNSRGVAGNEHTEEVIAEDNKSIEDTEAKDVTVGEEHDQSINGILTTILERDEGSEAEKNGARKSTPHTLKTDDKNGVKADVLQKMLLDNDLRSLNDLSQNDESTAKGDLTSSDGIIIFAAATGDGLRRTEGRGGRLRRRGRREKLGPGRLHESGESDNDERESNEADTSPV